MTKFSVLMSVYYGETARNLRECFESIVSQTVMPSEIILVEDGPLTEELYSVIHDFSNKLGNLITVPLKVNSGLGIALNEGMKHCKYDVIARMDTDDVNFPTRFEEQINYLDNHPDIDVVSAWIEEFDDSNPQNITIRKVPELNDDIYIFGKTRNPINHPVVMFRKDAIESVGGYEDFPLFEDYYLWVRLLMNGNKFYNIQHPLLHFRRTAGMIRRRGGKKYAQDEVAFQKAIYKLGYINKGKLIYNILIRFWVRLIPVKVRSWIYTQILR